MLRYEGLLVLVTLIAAAGWVFTKSALAEFSPYIFLALRFLIAALVIMLMSRASLLSLSRQQIIKGLGTGALLAVALLVWVLAVDQTHSIGEGAFIVSLAVVFVPLLGRAFFGLSIGRYVILALVPAVIGLALLSLQPAAEAANSGGFGMQFEFREAHVLFLLSTLGFALHVILTGRYAQGIPYMALTALQLVAIGVLALVAAVIFEGMLSDDWFDDISALAWIWLLCSALIATSLRFALQTKALAHLEPNNAAMVFMLEPVWTAVLGVLFLSEVLGLYQLLGCVFIFTSLLVYRAPLLRFWFSRVLKRPSSV